ncbi:hypothetical protein NESM_000767300 [Novymonas esmeraldas]|uniref:WW domain-containing protein n=1 Tax=Novymonas esmeraldas TaxID=1808958 RepID=A0AAW0EXT9_9TRYP
MSIRAVGWLQAKLGLDIGGRRSSEGEGGGGLGTDELAGFSTTQNRSSSADPVASVNGGPDPRLGGNGGASDRIADLASGWESKIGQVWKQASEKATSYWNANVRGGARSGDPFGFGVSGSQGGFGNGAAGSGEGLELDENGLPVTRNWYYYDAQLGRWTVSRDAPENVQREYYEKLEEAERERLGQKTVVAPPPPPPPGGVHRNAAGAGALPPPPGSGHAGLFGGGGGHGPHYAVPDYFGTTSAAPAAAAAAPAQPLPSYGGVYGHAFPAPPSTVSGHHGAYHAPPPHGSGTPATTSAQPSPYGQSLSDRSQISSPPAAPAYPYGASALPTAPYPAAATGGYPAALAAASPPPTTSPPPAVRASPAPHAYPSAAYNGPSTVPPAPAPPSTQQYAPAAHQAPGLNHYRTASGSNNGAGVSSLSSSANGGGGGPGGYTSPAAMDPYASYRGGAASNSVSAPGTGAGASVAPGPSQSPQYQYPLPPQASSAYAHPAATAAPVSTPAQQQPPPPPQSAEFGGYAAYPSVASLGTFQSSADITAARPSSMGLPPPPPSFKPFTTS